MKQDNKTTRELALEWWRNTTIFECQELAKKYKPDWPYDLVRTSSSTIERIYLAEQAKKVADLTEGSPDSTNPVHSFLVEENRRLKERIVVLEDTLRGSVEAMGDVVLYHSDKDSDPVNYPGHKLGGTIPFQKCKNSIHKAKEALNQK